MRWPAFAVVLPLLFFIGCGYVGPVLPPSPEIPAAVTDLNAVERGDKIVVTFTTPARTTDGVAITRFSNIELRVGPEQQPPENAKAYSPELPSPSDREDPQPKPIAFSIPVSDWTGQHISVVVRTAVRKTGHASAWSKKVDLDVMPPLEQLNVKAQSSADGIVLTWPRRDDAQYLVRRQAPTDNDPVDLATVNENRYVDISAQYDTEYRYTVTAKKSVAESLPSDPVSFSAKDIYPPAVPAGVTALAGPDAVDLAWQRNAEFDLQGYYIFRSTNNGPFEKQGALLALPTYVDHSVEHGKTYSYKISAIDKKGNESAPSAAAEIQY